MREFDNGSTVGDVQNPARRGGLQQALFRKHMPIAKTIPGVRKYEVSEDPVVSPMGGSNYHLVAILHFDDVAAIQNAFASAQGQAAVADVQTFATGGADIFLFNSREV
jgi:uncharacterized protein (TIGR02118 family)